MKPIRMISLFSGIGGLELGLEAALGVEVVAQVEVDPYCRAVLAQHWPDAMRLNDVTAAIPTGLRCDVLCGGFPCQPHSVAGARKGSDDERHLWPAMLEWIIATTPRLVVAENVTGLLTSSEGEVFSAVLSDLHRAGYDVHWRTIGAGDVGAPHRRRRVFIVGVRRGAKPLRLPPEVRPVWGHAGWPAGPGQPQHAYEPPRVTASVPQRRHRLKALENAVVPHCAYVAGRWARSLLAAPPSTHGRVVVQFLAGRRAARQPDLFAQDTVAAPKWPKHGSLIAGAVRVARGPAPGSAGLAWPTPTASDSLQRDTPAATARRVEIGKDITLSMRVGLEARAAKWPTATASDANGSGSRNTAGSAAHPGVSLTDAVRGDGGTGRAWPTPNAHVSNFGEGVETWEARRDALNPAWVELLMGFPEGWTIATYTERKKAPKKKDT